MAFRTLTAGSLLAFALAACSDGAPEAEQAAAPVEVIAEAEKEAATAESEVVAEEAVAETAAVVEPVADKAKEAAPAVAAAAPVAAAAAAPQIVKVAAEVAPPASFARCAVCHTTEKGGEDKLGPNLYGVYGKPAAQGSFAFSSAYKEAGLTMDEATLHKWLENPKGLVPGNRMSFPGIKDAAKRQEIIDYLKQQG